MLQVAGGAPSKAENRPETVTYGLAWARTAATLTVRAVLRWVQDQLQGSQRPDSESGGRQRWEEMSRGA